MLPIDLSADDLLALLQSGALCAAGDDGRISGVNTALCELTGQPAEAWEGQLLEGAVRMPPKTLCRLCQGSQAPANAPIPQVHAAFLHTATGDEIRVKIKHTQLPHGWVLCVVDPFSEDVTLTQAHSDFVSTVSHEFRTPLTSIKGFADTLLRYGAQLPDDQQRRFVSIIKDQADRLTRLVENLLTVSKLGAARVELSYRPIALGRLVDKVIQNVRGKGEVERHFQVDIPEALPEVWADPDKLEQVMLNLVDNAVKYSFAGSTVAVTARVAPDVPDALLITVADQGVGIPPEHLPKIFSKFSRIDNVLTRQVEGTGLGLYITKSLTLAMGGQINVESTQDTNAPFRTTFRLTLPAASPERQAAARLMPSDDDGGDAE